MTADDTIISATTLSDRVSLIGGPARVLRLTRRFKPPMCCLPGAIRDAIGVVGMRQVTFGFMRRGKYSGKSEVASGRLLT